MEGGKAIVPWAWHVAMRRHSARSMYKEACLAVCALYSLEGAGHWRSTRGCIMLARPLPRGQRPTRQHPPCVVLGRQLIDVDVRPLLAGLVPRACQQLRLAVRTQGQGAVSPIVGGLAMAPACPACACGWAGGKGRVVG